MYIVTALHYSQNNSVEYKKYEKHDKWVRDTLKLFSEETVTRFVSPMAT